MDILRYKKINEEMPNYQNGKIYIILNTIDDEIYVGSTVGTLSNRMSHHRYNAKIQHNSNVYKHT